MPEWRCDALLLRCRALAVAGKHDQVRQVLKIVGRSSRSFSQEVEWLRLVAETHHALGETGEALRAARRGIRLVERASEQTSSSELHDALSQHVVAFSEVGLTSLLDGGRPRAALLLANRVSRAQAIIDHPTAPSPLLVEYRATTRAIEEAENSGRDPRSIRRRQRALAHAIRRDRGGARGRPTLEKELPDSATVRRYVVVGGRLWSLDLHRGRVSASELSDVSAVARMVRQLLFRVRTAFVGSNSVSIDDLCEKLDRAVGYPGRLGVAEETLFLALDGTVPSIPFGLLGSLHDRSWALSASLAAAGVSDRSSGSVALIAGPGLQHAGAEVKRLSSIHGQARVLPAKSASAKRVVSALDGAGLVHIAAHSSVNLENPMFSSIRFADGDFTVHELSGLSSPPSVVVLASCESGAGAPIGMLSLGLTQALLRTGVGSVVGTVCEIPDNRDTVAVMTSLHNNDPADVAESTRMTREDESLNPAQRLIARCLLPATSGVWTPQN